VRPPPADAKEEARLAEVGWEEAAWQRAADQDPDLLLSLLLVFNDTRQMGRMAGRW
jgi:hypothetical protein